ncbi:MULTISPECIES: fimbrial protein [Acinetobacter]|uniref:fimbrial protein n=1 Tax=Acinetobacter TaxID=469 RepID=UPI0002AE9E25|nr:MULTISPECIES: fimbrial protein [Acinetobacter]ELW79756.1 fimbrial protein [Acinetobacter sp. WC-743]
MKKLLWLFAPLCLTSTQIFAANSNCVTYPMIEFNRTSGTINSFPYTQTFNDTNNTLLLNNCTPAPYTVAVRAVFKAASGNTDLVGSSPFSVSNGITISGSNANPTTLAAAKIWLMNNLRIEYRLRSNNDINPLSFDILALDTDYSVVPDTSAGPIKIINGEGYYAGLNGNGTTNSAIRNSRFKLTLLSTTKPSAAVIDALNNSVVRIHLGTFAYKYDDWGGALGNAPPPSGNPKVGTSEVYVNIQMNFALPTCTMANQIVNLAPVPTATLNSNQTANEQSFNVNIYCTAAMPNKVLLATITDSYTPSNVNTNGILKNSPSLANRSNVDVQLRDNADVPLAIGTQSPFYSIPVGSTATTFMKTLKARYYRSLATATPGYVQTQATVSIDYQ